MPSVVLDIGHGQGAKRPTGATHHGITERSCAEAYIDAAIGYLADRGVSVRVVRSGPYEERQTSWAVDTADLYVSCHVNSVIAPPDASAYGLALHYYPDHEAAARALIAGYGAHVKLSRVVVGICDGSGNWGKRGSACIGYVDRSVPALVFEPFFLDHSDHRWLSTPGGLDAVGVGLARGILRALGI